MDDDDRDSGASSDNDQDELLEDADDVQDDVDEDADAQGDDDDDNDNEEDEQEESGEQPSQTDMSTSDQGQGPTSQPRDPSIPPLPKLHPSIRKEALTAALYDIVPTMAAPQATSINAIACTPDMRYWFTGGSDGYIRKYDGGATINGKTLLTVAQRHPFVDTVTKAGVLMSYWENDEPPAKSGDEPTLSSVFSLAVHSEALWLLSGLESGGINLQSVRHDEGKRIHCLQKHNSAVSVLTLAADEKSVLSGSWDKNIFDWDLNTGDVKRSYLGSGGQISAIEVRPASSLRVPEASDEPIVNGSSTFASNNADKPKTNGVLSGPGGDDAPQTNGANGADASNGANGDVQMTDGVGGSQGSPRDSLFGDTDSLFGDADQGNAPSGGNFGNDEDDEFSRAIGGIDHQEVGPPAAADTEMVDAPPSSGPDASTNLTTQPSQATEAPKSPPKTNGLPKSDDIIEPPKPVAASQDAVATSDTVFLSAAIDGPLRVWDRRMEAPLAAIGNKPGVPPWCMSACWSPDGNYIYAGRRNGTVEEYSLHKGLRESSRTFKFPLGSGAVSCVRAMPNGRHLICASHDILRLYDLKHDTLEKKHSTVPFLIVPGPPRAGVISNLHIDPTCRYMLSAAGNRGWEGTSTEVLIGYEIGVTQ